MRSILTLFFLLPYCLLVVVIPGAAADPQDPQGTASLWEQWERAAEEGVKDPLLRWHYYYKDGLRIDSREKSFQFRLNGRILGDGGYTGADDLLDREYDLTAGLNWYLNKSIRLMFNYVWAKARDRETPLPVEDGTAHIVQARLQMVF
ncbi:MAG: hypothetical protein JRJ09_03570 [Deltaproteobacteria bacterium]|nr:hypothetical protein [Deltaproteobacteria bacterium]MBW2353924.1 hypothetical protein [Deltaproteobacteria bacterium]HDZ91866.1 hypothetical protein [Deltaproteobacteria bacterium]